MPIDLDPGFLHARYIFTLSGVPDQMIVTCGHEWDPTTETPDQAAADLAADWVTAWDTKLDNVYTFNGVEVDAMNNASQEVSGAATVNNVGSQTTSASLPPSIALLVKKVTGLRGRQHRGRLYIPGILTVNQVTETGALASGVQAQMQTAADAWFTALGTSGHAPYILHSVGVVSTPTAVTAFSVDPVAATQRRRMR